MENEKSVIKHNIDIGFHFNSAGFYIGEAGSSGKVVSAEMVRGAERADWGGTAGWYPLRLRDG